VQEQTWKLDCRAYLDLRSRYLGTCLSMDSSSQGNGYNCENGSQKRQRDSDDEMDNECLPISKRINSLSLTNTSIAQMAVNGWPTATTSQSLASTSALPAAPSIQHMPPAPCIEPILHMPLVMGGPNPVYGRTQGVPGGGFAGRGGGNSGIVNNGGFVTSVANGELMHEGLVNGGLMNGVMVDNLHHQERLASEPDLTPEDCPQYYTINSYLYRLHLERLQRQQDEQHSQHHQH